MDTSNKSDSGPDAISMIASVGTPLFVVSMLLYRIANGHWESVAFFGLIFVGVLIVYVRLFWHEEHDDANVPHDDDVLTSNEMDSSS